MATYVVSNFRDKFLMGALKSQKIHENLVHKTFSLYSVYQIIAVIYSIRLPDMFEHGSLETVVTSGFSPSNYCYSSIEDVLWNAKCIQFTHVVLWFLGLFFVNVLRKAIFWMSIVYSIQRCN